MEIKYQLEPKDFEALRAWAHGGVGVRGLCARRAAERRCRGQPSLVTSTDGLRADRARRAAHGCVVENPGLR